MRGRGMTTLDESCDSFGTKSDTAQGKIPKKGIKSTELCHKNKKNCHSSINIDCQMNCDKAVSKFGILFFALTL